MWVYRAAVGMTLGPGSSACWLFLLQRDRMIIGFQLPKKNGSGVYLPYST